MKEEFADELPTAEALVDQKAINANAQKKKEKQLVQQVVDLKSQLEETKTVLDEKNAVIDQLEEKNSNLALTSPEAENENANNGLYDIVVRVKPQKVQEITSQIIEGKKCIIIPLEENESMNINGVETSF